MKKFIKSLVPARIKLLFRKYNYKPSQSPFVNKSANETFSEIYKTNFWQGHKSLSGQGSDLDSTQTISKGLEQLIKNYSINSILDIPCGDFHWMQYVELGNCTYIGADIVKELIEKNKVTFAGRERVSFRQLNLIEDELPKVDLILIRDCFVHLNFEQIFSSLKQVIASGSTYLLSTSFPDHKLNYDIVTGDWRTIDLQSKPFQFPKPLEVMLESTAKENDQTPDKSLLLWKIEDLKSVVQ